MLRPARTNRTGLLRFHRRRINRSSEQNSMRSLAVTLGLLATAKNNQTGKKMDKLNSERLLKSDHYKVHLNFGILVN